MRVRNQQIQDFRHVQFAEQTLGSLDPALVNRRYVVERDKYSQ
ncbi:MAG: hypothetical protein ABJA98_11665 [Acidobacteriota bacterium]